MTVPRMRMLPTTSLILWSLGMLFSHRTATAQGSTTPVPAPTPAATAEAEPSGGEVQAPLPEVFDPLLSPAPGPARVLSSWQEALALVRRDSTAHRNARLSVERAEAEARVALAPALPRLRGTAQYAHHLIASRSAATPASPATSIPNPRGSFEAGLGLTVPLLRAKDWYDHGTAKDAVEAERLFGKDTDRAVVAAVANAVVGVATAERLAEVSRSSLRAALSTLNLTKRRSALGAATSLDVLRAEQDSSLSRSAVVSAAERLIAAREALGAALGSSEAWGVTPEMNVETLSASVRATCRIETDIMARSDVRAATAHAAVAERSVRSFGYGLVPTIDAFSTLTFYEPDSPVNDHHLTWTVGGLLNWEVYDGGLRYGQRDVARAEAGRASERLRDVKRQARLEVTQAVRAVHVAEANLALSARTREIAAEMARLARIAFVNGSGTSFDLVDTATQLREAELDFALKEFEVLRLEIAALLATSTCSV
jgi:multidrug efflux system outer membrane protein